MDLRGQGGQGERGYAMAALLVTIAIMSVLLSVALPVWRHEAQREKEAELVFRGQQYVRAIRLYNMKTGSLPPSVDVLVQGRYIRKKFKDPITNDDFEVISAGSPQAQPGMPGQPGRSGQAGTIAQPTTSGIASSSQNVAVGGLIGVRSKSKDESIMLYQGRSHYNEWTFLYVQQQPGRGGPGGMGAPGFPGRGGPGGPGGRGGRGGQGDGRGGRGDGRGFGPGGGRGGTGFGPGTTPIFPGGPGRGGRG